MVLFRLTRAMHSASNLRDDNSMRSETHTEPEEIVDDAAPVDAFLNNIGTHVPDVSSAPNRLRMRLMGTKAAEWRGRRGGPPRGSNPTQILPRAYSLRGICLVESMERSAFVIESS
jgi:hypothetical protein